MRGLVPSVANGPTPGLPLLWQGDEPWCLIEADALGPAFKAPIQRVTEPRSSGGIGASPML